MNNNKQYSILVWNIKGINSQEKWNATRAKINESSCQILCLQETKRENFDILYLKKFCSKHLNAFAFSPSVGASGGIITIWNGNMFDGNIVCSNGYCVTIKFTNKLNASTFHVSNVYGPSYSEGKMAFITWMLNLDTDDLEDWIIAGDFNLYRSVENRNKLGGDANEMQLFNDLISTLDLIELQFNGRTFTWSNMQLDHLLIKLDWVFCSPRWSFNNHPSTRVQPLDRPISDHIPYTITFGSSIPRSNIFRFESFWIEHVDFLKIVELHWNSTPYFANAAKTLNGKFKQVRQGLRN